MQNQKMALDRSVMVLQSKCVSHIS